MGYRKFSERPRASILTLGGLGALGGQHPRKSRPQKPTCYPAKVAKAPKVASDWPDPADLICAQCGGGMRSDPPTDPPNLMIFDGRQEIWLHPECRRFWFVDNPR
jgi:hypothetical protein